MAENKKSFVLYSDQRTIIDMLPDELAGKLLKHIYAYVNDDNPINENPMVNLAFEPIKLQLKRDLIKWSETRIGRSKGGLASAEARRNKSEQALTNSTNVNSVQQTLTNSTVNVNANVNVINNNIFSFNEFWELYPNKTGKQKSEQIFKKLKDSELQKIKDTLKSFINFKPFETYNHPNPTTYLNQKRWEDVIPQKETVQQTSQSVIDEARQDWLKKNGVTL